MATRAYGFPPGEPCRAGSGCPRHTYGWPPGPRCASARTPRSLDGLQGREEQVTDRPTVLDSQLELEELKRLVASRAPLARAHESPTARRIGEVRFGLMCGRSVYVQSPSTPSGLKRDNLGLWRYRICQVEPWRHSSSLDSVVAFIEEQSQRVKR